MPEEAKTEMPALASENEADAPLESAQAMPVQEGQQGGGEGNALDATDGQAPLDGTHGNAVSSRDGAVSPVGDGPVSERPAEAIASGTRLPGLEEDENADSGLEGTVADASSADEAGSSIQEDAKGDGAHSELPEGDIDLRNQPRVEAEHDEFLDAKGAPADSEGIKEVPMAVDSEEREPEWDEVQGSRVVPGGVVEAVLSETGESDETETKNTNAVSLQENDLAEVETPLHGLPEPPIDSPVSPLQFDDAGEGAFGARWWLKPEAIAAANAPSDAHAPSTSPHRTDYLTEDLPEPNRLRAARVPAKAAVELNRQRFEHLPSVADTESKQPNLLLIAGVLS
jgi:hypothetical protein